MNVSVNDVYNIKIEVNNCIRGALVLHPPLFAAVFNTPAAHSHFTSKKAIGMKDFLV